jgi:hypothetical protein
MSPSCGFSPQAHLGIEMPFGEFLEKRCQTSIDIL